MKACASTDPSPLPLADSPEAERPQAAMREARRRRNCPRGVHYPAPESVEPDGEVERARCRFCGGAIMRRASSRRWLFSGQLG